MERAPLTTTPESEFNSNHAQRQRLLTRLRLEPLSTITIRRELDILMPAARIFELKERGFNIVKVWTTENTDSGKKHRVALYVLQAGSNSHD